MIDELTKLNEAFDKKTPILVEAIINEDPTTPRYKDLLENYNMTLSMMSVINRTLLAVASKAKEENNNESNN